MINREIIRIKVVQLTYAYFQNGNKNIDSAEKELFFSLSKSYDLYILLLDLIVAVTNEARRRLEVTQAKARREGTELPSAKFADNRFVAQLEDNVQLAERMEMQKLKWIDYPEFVGHLFEQIEQCQAYKDYISSGPGDYVEDRELWRRLYRTLIEDNSDLDSLLEENSLYWNDDKEVVDTFVLKTIRRFEEANGAKQELLPEYDSDEEREFARKLFRASVLNADEYQHLMSEASRNWDFSRLAYMDVIIMQIAIAEILTFPSIPLSVTINEYVELSKFYSTARSGSYINGMLDGIARHLQATGRIAKHIGRDDKRE